MIDVNKITSTLAKLPDQQLQQYAQMHKSDPYIMALAMSESNRRKEMRAAGQGGPGMQEQPKVVDQMVAEMAPQQLPEDQGIGQLPAGDMNFADGGIIAFADGGDVERFNGQSKSWVEEFLYRNVTPAERARREKLQAEAAAGRLPTPYEQERAANMAKVSAGSTYTPEAYGVTTPAPLEQGARYPGAMPAAPKAAPAAPKPDTNRRPAPTDQAPAPASGLAALDPNTLYATALANAGKAERPEKGMLEALNAERKTAAESELSGVKALNEKFADAFKGRRERLDTREEAVGQMKDQNFGLALLQAGAAMMSTPGSLGTAIGKGVQSGSQQYIAGIDKINSAKDKLADARDRLDDLQLNRDEMSAREILKAENKIRDTALSGQGDMIKFVMERDKVDRETAMKVVDNQIKLGISQSESLNREKVAQISAGPGYERNQILKAAQGNESKVRTEYGKLQAKVMDNLSKDDNYKMATPVQQQVLYTTALRQAISTNPFLASYAADIGFSKAPAGSGKVYDLTAD